MQRARTMVPRDREPLQTRMVAADGGTPTPPPPLGWCQRLAQRWARPCVGRGQPQTSDSPLDLLAREGGYNMRMAMYHMML